MITVTTPPATNMLTVLATAARELAISDATAGLQELIGQASDVCARYCGRPEGFGRATVRQTERGVDLPLQLGLLCFQPRHVLAGGL